MSLTPTAAAILARAKAELRSKRANLCRHGVAPDHCRDCARENETTTTEETAHE